MATIVVARVPLLDVPLGRVLADGLARRIELERIVPSEEGVMPFFWVWGGGDGLAGSIADAPAVRSLEEVSRTADGRLYRAEWSAAIEGFVRGVGELGATIVLGRGTDDGWRFELRFSERDRIREFQAYCRDNGVSLEIERFYTVREGESGGGYELTDDQRETLRRAYARGYFDQPRAVTQSELAAEFDVSQRAISRRLRRGLDRLVGNTVAAGIERS